MIQARALTKRYVTGRTEIEALKAIDLTVPSGECWVISGPSGSGKSTLLGLLGGMTRPTAGDVLLAGHSITHLREHHRAQVRRQLVGVVFQEFAQVPRMTLLENVLLPLVPNGGPRREDRARADMLLRRFGIDSLRHLPVEQLSGGERQRGALARALVLNPPILLLDEPSAALDAGNLRRILDLLFMLRDEGRTLVVATHDPRVLDDPRVNQARHLVDGRFQPPPTPAAPW